MSYYTDTQLTSTITFTKSTMALLWFINLLLVFSFRVASVSSTIITFQNNCRTTIWPAIQPGAGKQILRNGGFRLRPRESVDIEAPVGWSGRFWGRRGCSFNGTTGKGSCTTGDCGGLLECAGAGGEPPVTLAEFTFNSPDDFYDISLVDGYNMPVSIITSGGTGMCDSVRCISDLNRSCPKDLQMVHQKRVFACKSACLAFNTPEYCCTGEFANPNTCKPSNYSRVFKNACPSAYSYAYDDATSIMTCQGANYLIRFC